MFTRKVKFSAFEAQMLKFLLFPFAVLYDLGTRLRNIMYDRGIKPSVGFDLPVISVGNLTVGGTGKTPMVEYITRLLTPANVLGILSRGYGRTTKGFRLASPGEDATSLGDEPFQYYRKFGEHVTVAVGEERSLAIPMILNERENINVMVLDDAYQHRKVRPSLSILLSDYNRPFYDDYLLPAGRLRESKEGADRADAIVITKCPTTLDSNEQLTIESQVRKWSDAPVFFTSINYSYPIPFSRTAVPLGERVLLVSGIADARPFVDYCQKHFTVVGHLEFRDHYQYGERDFKKIADAVTKYNATSVITTEKDMAKLDSDRFSTWISKYAFFYLPIAVRFLKGERDFDAMILSHVEEWADKNHE